MSKLNKEKARRGYWQRKHKRLAHQHSLLLAENEALVLNNNALHLSNSYFYELGKTTGREDMEQRQEPLLQQLQQTSKERFRKILEQNATLKKMTTNYDNINCTLQKILREALFCVKNPCSGPIPIKEVKILPESTVKEEVDKILKLKSDVQIPNQVKRRNRKKKKNLGKPEDTKHIEKEVF